MPLKNVGNRSTAPHTHLDSEGKESGQPHLMTI